MQVLDVAFIVAIAIVVFFANNEINKRRVARYRAVAAANGLEFDPGDPSNITSLDFEFLRRGSSNKATFTMWRPGSYSNRVFQYRYVTGSGKDRQVYNHTCALVALPFEAARTRLRPEGFATRLLNKVGLDDIELESPTFNDRYRITSADKQFATALLDPSMMGWLLEVPCELDLYLLGSWLLTVDDQRSAEELPDLLVRSEALVTHMPTVMQSLYPPAGRPSP
ncbi:MAG: DUF3137 domain-containing protein [Actinomycetota bacterium]|jgi:hypothetical protein